MTNPRLGFLRLFSIVPRVAFIAAAAIIFQGCGSDMGPPPDQTAKNAPPEPEKQPNVKSPGGGGTLKVKDIKKRS